VRQSLEKIRSLNSRRNSESSEESSSRKAAEIFRNAYDTIVSVAGGAADLERSRGGGLPGAPPSPPYLEACSKLREAKSVLYPDDYTIVHRVVGEGHEVKAVADMMQRDTKISAIDFARRSRYLR
jgi:hypothetical protein